MAIKQTKQKALDESISRTARLAFADMACMTDAIRQIGGKNRQSQ
jgi:hypothetical protein